MRAALERMGLRDLFCAEVTAEDGMETLAQRLLSAAIKLARPPDHCVVFETSPTGVCAAHNCTMKVRGPAVSLVRGFSLCPVSLLLGPERGVCCFTVAKCFQPQGGLGSKWESVCLRSARPKLRNLREVLPQLLVSFLQDASACLLLPSTLG